MSSFFRSRPHFVLGACLVGTAVLALASPGYGQPAPIKIAVVSLDAVAASSSAGKALSQKLDAFQQQVKGEAEVAANKMRDIQRQAAEGANSLSETRLTELQKEYEDAQIALKRLRDDRQREGQKMQEEGLRAIESQMEPVFQAIRDEEGYDLILNYVPGVVVMAAKKPPEAICPLRTRSRNRLSPGRSSTETRRAACSALVEKSHQAFQSRSPNM